MNKKTFYCRNCEREHPIDKLGRVNRYNKLCVECMAKITPLQRLS